MPRCLRDPEACARAAEGPSRPGWTQVGKTLEQSVRACGMHPSRPLKLGSWRTPGAWVRELAGG
eukprot:3858735-Pyramimonas_sp.AAC.1